MSQQTSYVNPLANLSKPQTRALAKAIQQSKSASDVVTRAQAAIKEARFNIKAATGNGSVKGAVAALKEAEGGIEKGKAQQQKLEAQFEKNPWLKQGYEQYQDLVRAAGNDGTAKSMLVEVDIDLTIAREDAPASRKKGKSELQGKNDPVEILLNGIAGNVAVEKLAELVDLKTPVTGEAKEESTAAGAKKKPAAEQATPVAAPAAALRFPPHLINRYRFQGDEVLDKRTDAVVFVDKGNELKAPANVEQETIDAMLDTAEARGWSSIRVFGTDQFKSGAYIKAASRGLQVDGYEPSPEEKAAVAANLKLNGKENKITAVAARDASSQVATDRVAPVRTAYLEPVTAAARGKAAKQFPQLATAFALEAAFEKTLVTALGKNNDGAKVLMGQFREQMAIRLERGEKLPEVEVRDRAPQQSKQQQVDQPER
ncbi:hypothetical protein AE925_11565 [Xanthomonas arboricola]|uniref:LPD7 domain-containing protein n=1 Tax=Xanthomonas arboricola TaxID=56448 RepID=UPI00069D9923|nr:LPD7 domain-containing protein [Xanthomonas arboricola]KOB18411.1 hypothetical protein AE925_11565 [Xanthomonas arboricola]